MPLVEVIFPNLASVFFDDRRYHTWIAMRYFRIVTVPCNGTLLAVDCAVCNARVVGVQLETHSL
jgi:hypothetical protein